MSEGFTAIQVDSRTLGTMVARLVDDLNRPDLQSQAISYIQDAIRWAQRRPWFFAEFDNEATATYANSTIYPQGSTIQVNITGTLYAFVATNTGTSASSSTPAWPSTVFTVPTQGTLPPPQPGTAGTVVDNTITWANVGQWSTTAFTQLSTVYSINQYTPPIDYATPERVEITVPNLRYELTFIDYGQLRDYDVIRLGGSQAGAVVAYPTFWAWWEQQIFLWPYPNSFYPLTLSYRTAPTIITSMSASNFWTTTAEAFIRAEAARRICLMIIHDKEAANDFAMNRDVEKASLISQGIMQRSPANSGIPASPW